MVDSKQQKMGYNPFAISYLLCLFLTLLLPSPSNAQLLKVANGRMKEISVEKKEFVLSYQNPVNRQDEKLRIKIDDQTGFSEEVRWEDFRINDPVSVDYEEIPGGILRAVQVKRVAVRGVPKEIRRPF